MICDLRTQIDYKDTLNQNLSHHLNFVESLFEEEKVERKVLSDRIQEFCGIKKQVTTEIKRDETTLPDPINVTKKYPSRHETIKLLTKRSENLAREAKRKEDEAVSSGLLAPDAQTVIK